ncbi:hypothetical protein [Pseudomonas chlororaphis]|uniref:hypothetical protein n=1 Tax=Pseudomonas chlororaphis TaxID=587753 RepID=UPI000F56F72B|nr:hypothetical protein [Pseudomonas chlororaphis]AZC56414.1 hypothetical protein C4K34_2249 [Pseudomonas chlororaphis subsp. piscium]AZC68860.1 hypothetical protein C4K32_2198 [Pseudomonas chlororaphis subsp. piscium]
MDWLTFLSSIVNAVAWPATLVVLLVLIREQLPQIAKSLRRLKYKDIEMEFGEAAKAIANEVQTIMPAAQADNKIAGQEKEEVKARLEAIAELAPRAAILESWLQVEAAAADVIRQNNLGVLTPYPGPMRLRDSLHKGGILNKRQLAIFEQLRTLRNEAVHVPEAEFTKAAVSNYIESSIAIASYLEGRAMDSN